MLSPDLVILKGGRPDLVMKCSPDQCCFYERINGGKSNIIFVLFRRLSLTKCQNFSDWRATDLQLA